MTIIIWRLNEMTIGFGRGNTFPELRVRKYFERDDDDENDEN